MVDDKRFRIGVVIVNFNSGEYLSLCLRSLSNSLAPLDVVVVDNDSHDQSLDGIDRILGGQHKFKLVENSENEGFSKAVNRGMLMLTNRYVVLLNPDCTIFPHTLLSLQKSMVTNKKIGIAGAAIFNHDGSEQRGCRRNEPTLKRSAVTALGLGRKYEGIDLTYSDYPRQPTLVDAVSGAAMMVRREFFDQVGGMDEEFFLHCEDLDLCRRFRDMDYLVVFCPAATVFHHKGASGGVTSNQVEKYKHQGMLIYIDKHSEESDRDKRLTRFLIKGHYLYGVVKNTLQRIFIGILPVKKSRNLLHEFNSLDIVHNTRPVVLVTGAKSDVGDFLLKKLAENGFRCFAISRNDVPETRSGPNVIWLKLEYFSKSTSDNFGEIFAWVNLAPIWTSRSLAKVIHNFKPSRIVSISSTSIEGKSDSENDRDVEVVNRLTDGEKWLQHYAEKFKIDCRILRPTMLYGGPRNQNINFLKKIIRVIRVFPLVGGGVGKRQPVHAEDIAIACVRSLKAMPLGGVRTYNLGGAETLAYREMIDRVFESMDMRPRYINIPLSVVRKMVKLASIMPGLGFLTPEMVDRTEMDLVYSTKSAVRDLGFKPRNFTP